MPLRTAGFSRPTALTFGDATTDRVTCGAAADISGATAFSGGVLAKVTTFTDSRYFSAKANNPATRGWGVALQGTAGGIFIVFVGATNMAYFATAAPLVLNRWHFIAWTVDTTLGAGLKCRLYVSPSVDAALLEIPLSVSTEGATLVADTNADTFLWGNTSTTVAALQGSIALGFYIPSMVWSLTQLQNWQQDPLRVLPTMRVFTVFDKETGLLTDRTGLGHDGTVT